MAGSPGYDGTIRINTSLNADGMNKGTKDIAKGTSASLGGLMSTIKKLALTIGFLFTTEKIISFVRAAIQSFDIMGSSFGAKITELKTAFDALKGALVNALLAALVALMPYIMAAIDGFVRLLNVISQVITVLSGAAAAQNKLVSATKAAKGALASFDQLNVLQKPADAQAALPGVPVISPEIIAQIEAFKAAFLEFIQPIRDALGRLYDVLLPLATTVWDLYLKPFYETVLVPFGNWIMKDVAPIALDAITEAIRILNQVLIVAQPWLKDIWDNWLKPIADWTGGVIVDVLTFVRDRLRDLADWMEKNPDKVREFIKFLGDLAAAWLIVAGVYQTISLIGALVAAVQTAIATGTLAAAIAVGLMTIELWAIIILLGILFYLLQSPAFKEAIEDWKIFFTGLGQHIQRVIDDFRTSFINALNTIEGRFPILGGIIKGVLNIVIDQLNNLMWGITQALNLLTMQSPLGALLGMPTIPPITPPVIPHLATGAVIPPNAAFAAILGDQRSGTNIEAPESLIRQIVSEEMGKIQADIRISFEGNLAALVRELNPHITRENVRIGGSLIKSGTVL